MAIQFKKASKKEARLRMAITGPSGTGKTYTSLAIAQALGGKVAVIDTERGSASKYSNEFDFDVLELENFAPANYVEAISAADSAGYDILIIDSLSHAWAGKGGALEMVDKAAARTESKNTYFAWRDVTPEQNKMVDAILRSRCHIIACLRSKTDYVIEKDRNGKQVPTKVGLAPIQRDGIEYEFDIVGDMDYQHSITFSKSRCRELDGVEIALPGPQVAEVLTTWLTDGEPVDHQAVADARKRILELLIEMGKTPEQAQKVFNKEFYPLSLAELTERITKAETVVAEKNKSAQAATTNQQPTT